MKLLVNRFSFIFLYLNYFILHKPVICVRKSSLKNSAKLALTFSGLNFETNGGSFRKITETFNHLSAMNNNYNSRLNLKYCGKKLKSSSSYIIGGIETARNEFPFVVSILENDKLACTATIINNWWIITAAHCIHNWDNNKLANITSFSIVTGGHSSTDGEVYRVTRLIPHNKYIRVTQYADIALIRVDRKIRFDDKVNAICLPTKQFEESTGVLTTVGWGRYSGDAPMTPSPTLQKVDITIISDKQCANIYAADKLIIFKSVVCSLSPSRLKGTCNGDSGGPAFQYRNRRFVLVGITSWTYGTDMFTNACSTRMPNVYTEVSHYIDWIYQTLRA